MGPTTKHTRQADKLCACIKKVRKTIKGNYKKQQKESRPSRREGVRHRSAMPSEGRAIAICVKSVIQSRGRTLKKFKCGKSPKLTTQKLI